MQDLHGSIKYVPALVPGTYANVGASPTVVGTPIVIDLQGARGCEFVIVTGTQTDTGATYAVTMDDGAASNLSDAAAVTSEATGLIGTLAGASYDQTADGVCKKVGYAGNKRYVRLTITETGAASGDSPVAVIAALWMMKGPQS